MQAIILTEGFCFSFCHPINTNTKAPTACRKLNYDSWKLFSHIVFLSWTCPILWKDIEPFVDFSFFPMASFLQLLCSRSRLWSTCFRWKMTCVCKCAKTWNLYSLAHSLRSARKQAANSEQRASPPFCIKSLHKKDIQIIPLKLFNVKTYLFVSALRFAVP